MGLTKDDIVEAVAKEIGFQKNQSVELVETLLELIKKTLESGEDVLVSGFGKFRVREKKERRGRNPATGSDMMLRPRRVVTFNCSGKLRRKINQIRLAAGNL
jgi:integration host factor subunit alpha